MALLLDTQVALWSVFDAERLGGAARERLEDPSEAAYVSVVSLWEVAIKHRIGKLSVPARVVSIGAAAAGFGTLGVTAGHVFRLADLPRIDGHGDPFDHLLLAQAMEEGLTLVTADRALAGYGVPILPA